MLTQKKGKLHRHAGPLHLKDLNGCNGERKCSSIGTCISFHLTSRTNAFRNAPALIHGLYSIRFSQLTHQASDFLVIRSVSYQQTFINTGRNRGFLDKAPLSSCFYEYLFRNLCDDRT